MPTEPSFPEPSRHRCPDCGGALTSARCTSCGLALAGEDAYALWRIDQGIYQLLGRRRVVLVRLRARAPRTPAAAAPVAGPGTSAPVALPPPPPPPPPPAGEEGDPGDPGDPGAEAARPGARHLRLIPGVDANIAPP